MLSHKQIQIKRVYDEPSETDGYRMLVDRLWPRGMTKEAAALDEWNKNIAPSPDLRKWFAHKDERFDEFAKRYLLELDNQTDELNRLRKIAKSGKLTLLYAAKNKTANHAIILEKKLLR